MLEQKFYDKADMIIEKVKNTNYYRTDRKDAEITRHLFQLQGEFQKERNPHKLLLQLQ